MSGFFRAVGKVAGVVAGVALIASGLGAPLAIGGMALSTAASAVSAIAMTAAQLTAKGPTAQGQVNDRVTGANNPQPYAMGRTYSGGVQVHDIGYGGEVDDVKNPYRFMAVTHSCCGPIDAYETTLLDFTATSFSGTAATGYYLDHFWRDSQLGARPEADALTPQFPGAPDWGTDYKMSSHAACGYSFKWSKKGKRFPGGQIPVIGEVLRGVKVYDPRLDSTFPGGSGACRLGDESTYVYSTNNALHAGTYGYGRYVNGKKVFGVAMGDAVDFADIVAWANTIDANGWAISGTIYEPGDKWNNLKRIAQAGGGRPIPAGGKLRFDHLAPRTSLATITRDDLADGTLKAGKGPGWKERHNTIVPRYRSEPHQWNYVQSAAVTVAAFLAADGEEKSDEVQYDLCADKDQAAQLGTYEVYERREAGPFVVPLKPAWRIYEIGDCLTLGADLELGDGAVKAIIKRKRVDPTSGIVTFTMSAETDAKHAAALAAVGTAPDVVTPPTGEDIDDVTGSNGIPASFVTQMITASYVTDADPADGLIQGTATALTIETHTRTYPDLDTAVSVTGATLTTDVGGAALTANTQYHIYYDDAGRSGGAVTYKATTIAADAATSGTHPYRHYVGSPKTDVVGGTGTKTGGAAPGGWDPNSYNN